MESIEKMNYESFKNQNEEYKKRSRRLLSSILRASPRQDVIDVLKKLKIIKMDYNKNTDKIETMLVEKCKCGKQAIGYVGLTGTEQIPFCKDCIKEIEE